MKPYFYKYFGDHILFGITILATLALASCMFVPNEDAKQDKNEPVLCQGGVLQANEKITIEACDPAIAACDPHIDTWDPTGAAGWHQIGDNGGYYAGTKLWAWNGPGGETIASAYLWSTPLTQVPGEPEPVIIPPQYWKESLKCASTGESALVRSKGQSSGYLMSFKSGGIYCMLQNPKTFLTDCKSPHSPAVFVLGQDFRDFGKECFETINKIREKEGKSALERNEIAECCADTDAEHNWSVKIHHDWMCSYGGSGGTHQNECYFDYYESIDQILDICIWDHMYEDEKKCYQQYGSNCPDDCECDHYYDMVINPDVKKVACGLYVNQSSDGHTYYMSVQNYVE